MHPEVQRYRAKIGEFLDQHEGLGRQSPLFRWLDEEGFTDRTARNEALSYFGHTRYIREPLGLVRAMFYHRPEAQLPPQIDDRAHHELEPYWIIRYDLGAGPEAWEAARQAKADRDRESVEKQRAREALYQAEQRLRHQDGDCNGTRREWPYSCPICEQAKYTKDLRRELRDMVTIDEAMIERVSKIINTDDIVNGATGTWDFAWTRPFALRLINAVLGR